MTEHICKKTDLVEHAATHQKPYHFVDSGLPNVYLIGIKYWVCRKCGAVSAEIPAPTQLMNVIAESIVMKRGILSGGETKFLRKRAGKKASDFAALINMTPEHFSKLETGKHRITEPLDKLIRLIYGLLSNDTALQKMIAENVEEWLKSIRKDEAVVSIQIKRTPEDDWLPCAA